MKTYIRTGFMGWVGVAAALSSWSASAVQEIDLAETPRVQSEALSVDVGSLVIEVVNRLPYGKYEIQVHRFSMPIDPLTPPGQQQTQDVSGDGCDEVRRGINKLETATDEVDIPNIVKNLGDAISDGDCNDTNLEGKADKLIDATKERRHLRIESGERLTVLVVRLNQDGGQEEVWSRQYQTGARAWRLDYGFMFVPDKDDEFFTRALDDGSGMFEIVEREDRNDLQFVPALMYTWNPYGWFWRNAPESLGFSAGLGFDFDNPVVFAGPSWTIAQNVTVNGGLVVHKQTRLDGRFDLSDPVIGTDLSDDALTEESFDYSWFFGISFNFGSAPDSHRQTNGGTNGESNEE